MTRTRHFAKGLIVVAAIAVAASRASAGPILDFFGLGENNPPSSYSPAHYWTPTVSRFNDCLHGPRLGVYAPDRHPEIATGNDILTFPSAVAAPAATIIVPPTPPATSTAR
jgi:hypothetical protein